MLTVENVNFSRQGKIILEGINWQLETGRVNAIVGRNGAGKSTLLQLLSGQTPPDTGRILLQGQCASVLSVAQRSRQIAIVSQRLENISQLSVRECLALGCLPWAGSANLRNHEIAREVDTWLEKLSLSELQDRPLSRLSGGEQQRVLLGQALAQRTPILLLDEPTNHLDLTQQYQLMSDLKESGKTLVVTLHDINLTRRFVDQLLLLDNGQVLTSGNPAEVLSGRILTELYQMPFAELDSDQLPVSHFVPTV